MEKLSNIYQSLLHAIECSSYNYYKIYQKLVMITKMEFLNDESDISKYHFERFSKNYFPLINEVILSLEVYFEFLNDCLSFKSLEGVNFDKNYFIEIYAKKTDELNLLKIQKQKLIKEITPLINLLNNNDKQVFFALQNIITLELLQTDEEISKVSKEIEKLEDIRKRLDV